MENKNKIILIVSIIIILGSVTASIFLLTKKDTEEPFTIDGIILAENKEILKDNKIEELDITNVSLLTRDNISTYKATLTNNTEKSININKLYVIFYQEEKETKILALKDIVLDLDENTYINITTERDLSKTTKIEYIIE